ncbi:MAG: T9SS type A sorting domain-containing protein [Bacteroidetes bacterium]|nr:T9SS type A sorting domain-containing protein [Bacteroidota bacterium]
MKKLEKDLIMFICFKNGYQQSVGKILAVLFIFLFANNVHAQTSQWAKSIQSEGFDEGFDLVTDAEGNTYIAGQIEFDANFGNGVVIPSAGIHDIFFAKYSPTGRLVWAKVQGGKGGDKVQSITLDDFGHLYVAGEFDDTCYWDGIMKYTNGPGVNNMFIAKYDTSGLIHWVRNIAIGGFLQTRGYGVTCDEAGNVYACGGTKGDTYYDNTFLFTSAGDYDGTLVKFDPSGTLQWARRMGGTESDKAYGVASDRNGSIYVTGYFVGTADFSPSVNLVGQGHTDIFLSKYDVDGNLQWAKQAGDTGFDRAHDITVNVNGQIIITGEFQTGHFGPNIAYSRGNEDMFLAAYDASGNNLWAISGGSEEDDIGRGVSHDSSGNIIVIGDYASSGIFTPDTVVSNGYADVFVASYRSDGAVLNWVRSFGGLDNDRGRGVGTDLAGNVSICGEYVDSTRFDAINLIGDTLLDIFITKIIPGNYCATQAVVTTPATCHGSCDGVAVASGIGSGPFTYSWSTNPVQSGPTATGLCGGNYSVTTVDANGCSSTALISIVDPPLLQSSATSTNASCAGSCNGTALATANGQGPFTFIWSTVPPHSGASVSGLCQGTYTVTVIDSFGCSTHSDVIITDPTAMLATTSFVNANCAGSCNGTAIASASGQGAVSYSWSTNPPQNSSNATGLCQGTYTVIATDAAGCTASSSVTLTDPLPLQQTSTFVNASCAGSCDGVALASASGQGPFTYSWSTNPPQNNSTASGLCQGSYTVTATDAGGCTATSSVTLTDPQALQMTGVVVNATCIGCSDGSIDIQINGGTSGYQYLWSNTSVNEDQQNLSEGIYSVCVTDQNNCSLCDTFTVFDPATGLETLNPNQAYYVYPNPFSSFTTIRFENASAESTQYKVFAATGQLIFSDEFTGNELHFDGNELESGVYFLQVIRSRNEEMFIVPLLVKK